jgi:hypothetical protein
MAKKWNVWIDHRAALILFLLLAPGGCASNPPDPTLKAELVLTRLGDRTHRNVTAFVDVNGARAVELDREEGFSAPIRPGPTIVSVSGPPDPGHYSIRFYAEAGKTYRLEVSPRSQTYISPASETATGYETVENEGAFKILPEALSGPSR